MTNAADAVNLRTSTGVTIPKLTSDHTNFLNKTVIVYGKTNSGKSRVIRWILRSLKDHVPVCFVVSPTEATNHAYEGHVPFASVHDSADSIDRLVDNVWDRQTKITSIYANTHDEQFLLGFYKKTKPQALDAKLCQLMDVRRKILSVALDANATDSTVKKREALQTEVKDEIIGRLRALIMANPPKVLSEDEKITLRYFNVNPRAVLVLDDCITETKSLQREKQNVVYTNRWVHLTLVIASQDIRNVNTSFRRNASLSVFCNAEAAMSFFGNNGFSNASDKKKIKAVIDTVFGDPTKYYRLAYIIGHPVSEFHYIEHGLQNEPIAFGSQAFKRFCEHQTKKNSEPGRLAFNKFDAFFAGER